MLEPFLPTVNVLAAASPVPSLTVTVSPALGVAGRVIVMPEAVATINSPTLAV